MSTTRLQTTLG